MNTKVPTDKLYLDGAWIAPSGSSTIDVVNPSTEQPLASIPAATAADADRAVRAARRASSPRRSRPRCRSTASLPPPSWRRPSTTSRRSATR